MDNLTGHYTTANEALESWFAQPTTQKALAKANRRTAGGECGEGMVRVVLAANKMEADGFLSRASREDVCRVLTTALKRHSLNRRANTQRIHVLQETPGKKSVLDVRLGDVAERRYNAGECRTGEAVDTIEAFLEAFPATDRTTLETVVACGEQSLAAEVLGVTRQAISHRLHKAIDVNKARQWACGAA
jgi:hypothetical protein